MKKLSVCLFSALICGIAHTATGSTTGIDIFKDGFNNPTGWTQPTRSYKYTVGADGVTLYHGKQKLPITLTTPATPGTQQQVTDFAIAPKPRTTPTPTPTPGSSPTPGSTPSPTPGSSTTPSSTPSSTPSPTPGSSTTPSSTPSSTPAVSTPKPAGWKGMSGAAKVGTVLTAAGGAAMVYQGTAGQDEHTGWDVASGVTGGVMTGAAIGSAVPVIGTVIGAVGGGLLGGIIAGSQLFSETDCLYDPVLKKQDGSPTFTCCNTVFNKGERQVGIGGYMFCDSTNENGQPLAGVRQCLQGGSATELGWWDSLWADDTWDANCKPRWCNNNTPPNANVVPVADTEKMCWNWEPANPQDDLGDSPVVVPDPYAPIISQIQSAILAYEKQCDTTQESKADGDATRLDN